MIAIVNLKLKLLKEAGVINQLERGYRRPRNEEPGEYQEYLVDTETDEVPDLL